MAAMRVRWWGWVVAAVASLMVLPAAAQAEGGAVERARPNVLFIAVDDLRPQLGCYGVEFMRTPGIDALAARSVRFDRAYCMVPTCGASRAAMMTALRPTRERFRTFRTRVDEDAPGVVPMHTHFRAHGYTTVSIGKVLHHTDDAADGWSVAPWTPRASGMTAYQLAESLAVLESHGRGPVTESADVPDEAYPDHAVATRAVEALGELAGEGSPFFLAVGFYKPHLPFVAPRRYWGLYPEGVVRLPDGYGEPADAPGAALHHSGELRNYADVPSDRGVPIDAALARRLVHGYYACVSFTDAQVARVLAALEERGLADDTVVVLWGDHGWQLGEHGLWNKHSCFETSMRVPLIVHVPEGVDAEVVRGAVARGLVESIDLYPTLCELTGLPVPGHVQGVSLVEQLRDPAEHPGRGFAVGRFGNGDTIRTERYRYAEYTSGGPDGPRVVGRMLFDHTTDPGETNNLTDELRDSATVEHLSGELRGVRVAGDGSG